MKELLLKELITKMQSELAELESAALATKNFATDQEFKAESKYDTRSLEASYLASAEAKRVEDLKLDIQMLEEVDLGATARIGEICIGSLVKLRHNEQERSYFLIPTAGGTMLTVNGQAVLVVSVFSPLGDAMMGLKVGEDFEIETPKETRNYEIVSFE